MTKTLAPKGSLARCGAVDALITPRQSQALAAPATYGIELGTGGLTLRQREYVSKTPSLSAGMVKRAFVATASPRQAIKAKCLACSNWQREEVEFCRIDTCPLWAYRPYRAASDSALESDHGSQ